MLGCIRQQFYLILILFINCNFRSKSDEKAKVGGSAPKGEGASAPKAQPTRGTQGIGRLHRPAFLPTPSSLSINWKTLEKP